MKNARTDFFQKNNMDISCNSVLLKLQRADDIARTKLFEFHIKYTYSNWVPILLSKNDKSEITGIPIESNGIYQYRFTKKFWDIFCNFMNKDPHWSDAIYIGKNDGGSSFIFDRSYSCHNTASNLYNQYLEEGTLIAKADSNEAHSWKIAKMAIEFDIHVNEILNEIEARYCITRKKDAYPLEQYSLEKWKEKNGGSLPIFNQI